MQTPYTVINQGPESEAVADDGETQTTEMDLDFEGSYERPSWLSSFIDEGSPESHMYYQARKTVLEMLRDRGYLVPNEEIELSLQQFRERYGDEADHDRLRVSAPHKDDPNNKILVHFFGPDLIKVNNIRPFTNLMLNKEALSRLILIVEKKMTSQAMKALEHLPFQIEIFQLTELLINITKHELKPKHQVLTAEEKQRLLEKYKVEEKQLPRMSQKDALARYYAFEKGTALKIMYDCGGTEALNTYRIVW